jgi:hypothetical protein
MEIVYADHTRDLTTFFDVVKQEETYKVYKKNIHHNFIEMVLEDTLENCVDYITNITKE